MANEGSADASGGHFDFRPWITLRDVRRNVPTLPTATPAIRPRSGLSELELEVGAMRLSLS